MQAAVEAPTQVGSVPKAVAKRGIPAVMVQAEKKAAPVTAVPMAVVAASKATKLQAAVATQAMEKISPNPAVPIMVAGKKDIHREEMAAKIKAVPVADVMEALDMVAVVPAKKPVAVAVATLALAAWRLCCSILFGFS